MNANLPSPRRRVVSKPRVEWRGPRRAHARARLGIRTRCGYLLFRVFV
jgi:hypothetical protein